MKMVIEIDEEDWKDINDIHFIREDLKFKIGKAIMKGTPLPEITTERYKPIILQEHDAEPRTMRAILDVETNDIYILETTKGFAESMGMTIEEVNVDENSD